MTQRSILVVGGGIAGLTMANALAEAGHVVEVVEIAPDWPTVGWGLSWDPVDIAAVHTVHGTPGT